MKWFFSKFKKGLLLIVLPVVIVFLGNKVYGAFSGGADLLADTVPYSRGIRLAIVIGAAIIAPFLLGFVTDFRWFRSAMEKLIERVPAKFQWILKTVFKSGSAADAMPSGEVVMFALNAHEKDPTYKFGVVQQTFRYLGGKDFGEPHCIIMDMVPPLPIGGFFIKKRSELIFLSPRFNLKDLMITVLSSGFNFPNDNKPSKPQA